jgi:hypothetical protein
VDCSNADIRFSKAGNNELDICVNWKLPEIFKNYFGSAPDIKFSYTSSAGLKVSGLPQDFSFISEKIDFIKEMKDYLNNINNKDTCGKLGEIVGENLIDTKFAVSPSIKSDNSGVVFSFSAVMYVYLLKNPAYEITYIKIDKVFSITIPSGFSLDNLWNSIGDMLKDSTGSFLDALVSDAEALCKIIAVYGAQEGIERISSALCRLGLESLRLGIKSAALEIAGNLAKGAGGAVLAWEVLKRIFGDDPPGPRPLPDKKPDPPTDLMLSCKSRDITLTWKAPDSANATHGNAYETSMYNGTDASDALKIQSVDGDKLTCTFTSEIGYAGNFYEFTVYSSLKGIFSESVAEKRMNKVTTPTNFDVCYNTTGLVMSWFSVPGVAKYDLKTVYDANEENHVETSYINYIPDLNSNFWYRGGRFSISVRSMHEIPEFCSPFCMAQTWTRPDPVSELSVLIDSSGIDVTWAKVSSENNKYTIRVSTSGQPDRRDYTSDTNHIRIAFTVVCGREYTVGVTYQPGAAKTLPSVEGVVKAIYCPTTTFTVDSCQPFQDTGIEVKPCEGHNDQVRKRYVVNEPASREVQRRRISAVYRQARIRARGHQRGRGHWADRRQGVPCRQIREISRRRVRQAVPMPQRRSVSTVRQRTN